MLRIIAVLIIMFSLPVSAAVVKDLKYKDVNMLDLGIENVLSLLYRNDPSGKYDVQVTKRDRDLYILIARAVDTASSDSPLKKLREQCTTHITFLNSVNDNSVTPQGAFAYQFVPKSMEHSKRVELMKAVVPKILLMGIVADKDGALQQCVVALGSEDIMYK